MPSRIDQKVGLLLFWKPARLGPVLPVHTILRVRSLLLTKPAAQQRPTVGVPATVSPMIRLELVGALDSIGQRNPAKTSRKSP